ncbi:VCBS repeat-containing protein [Gilvimarinus sp. SDUM040013]|uniref:VCBS repeat-containing protein n=1 Tax=Gilvimarinus gilvus TaxID=3058038 RepID=A0ABU4S0C0_9GAMM|nr:VCBS repeat-containing protein [Gilvimarinus sp. SDUM040013]MDO3385897.1 VCBS repeat-containing protein [Gilvimarinus sp. SDUM040013]MDX6850600.1 VCBS repeat-containing protein [Gilvimarinus sp. SDUM040013]
MLIWRVVVLLTVWLLSAAQATAAEQQKIKPEQIVALVQQYCGACHTTPSSQLLPKASWPVVIDSMAELSAQRFGKPFIPDSALHHIKALYYGSAPKALPVLPYIDKPHSQVQFARHSLSAPTQVPQIMSVTKVTQSAHGFEFLLADAETGQLKKLWGEVGQLEQWQEQSIAEIGLPVAVDTLDVNGDNLLDYIVADLGELPPNGNPSGKVYVLLNNGKGGFEKKLLVEKLGRVSDVNALDLDQDGDTDIAIAVFGGQGKGEVLWLEKTSTGYQPHTLLTMSGALNIEDTDLNKDGIVDLVTLVAQEHETLIAFVGVGDGQFERHDLVSAGHPMFGATSLTVVDLDSDGDDDLLFTNGDAFDTQTDPKPYHGVQWLENRGKLKFTARDVGRYYGAVNAKAADMDGDGDLDIVASSWVNYWDDPKRNALVWYENKGDQQFHPYPISQQLRGLVPLVIEDFTGDGRADILTGSFRMDLLHQVLKREGDTLSFEINRSDEAPRSDRLMMFISQPIKNSE